MVQSLPKAAAPHFSALHTAVGLPRRSFCLCAAALLRPESGGGKGCPQRALVCAAPRAWLPLRAWLLPLGRELAFCFAVRCVYVAKSSRRAAAARQQPKGLSARRSFSTGQPYAAAALASARRRYDKRQKKSSRRQPRRRTRHDPPGPPHRRDFLLDSGLRRVLLLCAPLGDPAARRRRRGARRGGAPRLTQFVHPRRLLRPRMAVSGRFLRRGILRILLPASSGLLPPRRRHRRRLRAENTRGDGV